MRILRSLAISASGLTAQRLRLDLVAGNVANMETTRTPEGGPYRRKTAVFAEKLARAREEGFPGRGVQVAAVVDDPAPPRLVYDPQHPDADARGYVAYPNVNLADEMVEMVRASRAYEANVTVLNAGKNMALKALEIGRG